MAQSILLCRSSTPGSVPAAGVFDTNTLVINLADSLLFWRTSGNVVKSLDLTLSSVLQANSPALTGTPTAPTANPGTNSTQIATTGFIAGALTPYLTAASASSTYAPIASPSFTGTPSAPTAAVGTNNTQIATTAFVASAVSSTASYVGPTPATPSSNTNLANTDYERDQYCTGTITLTAANGGTGWKTGVIRNDNAVTGIVSVTVPSGATLDGVTNGVILVFPAQRLRVRQIGSTSYRSDWIERYPIIGQRSVPQSAQVAAVDFYLPDGYASFDLLCTEVQVASSTALCFRMSSDGGTTIRSGTNDYSYVFGGANVNGAGGGGSTANLGILAAVGINPASGTSYPGMTVDSNIVPGSAVQSVPRNMVLSRATFVNTNPGNQLDYTGSYCNILTTRANFFRILTGSGASFSGNFQLRGRQ